MDGSADRPAVVPPKAGAGNPTDGNPPLVGRHDALRTFGQALDAASRGVFQFLSLVGEPGAGKTRLLGELAAAAARGYRDLIALWGRAAEFEQEMPFGVVVDALDDHVEDRGPDLLDRLGAETARLLASVLPSVRAAASPGPGDAPAAAGTRRDLTGRYRLYRGVRRLLDELARPHGLVLILDDVHWADDASIELLDHLVRHPPSGTVLVAIAYRPAQASPRLAALLADAGGRQVPVGPLTLAEAGELLGPQMSRPRCQALHEASGGNPFYLQALARMDQGGEVAGGTGEALPPAVRAALQLELTGLSPDALLVAQAAAVAADEFEPALAAVAAEVTEDTALAALNEMAARDIVRSASAGRLRFRHPLVRRATYDFAAAGWRLGAHARIAAHLARVGAPAALRAHHVERSAPFGDRAAVATLLEAARAVSAQAPATAAHWLEVALALMPDETAGAAGPAGPDRHVELLLEVARLRAVSGQLTEGREAAREVLRRLPLGDHARRAQAARFCALMERQLDRPHEARAVLLAELRRIPDPQSATAVPLRTRLVAESLMRGDIRAAQAVLDLMPEGAGVVEPAVAVAIAALRPLPAYASGRIDDAARYIEAADQLLAAAPDDHLAEWLDAIAWLCWTETVVGRHRSALAHFDRAVAVARGTGQSYIISNLLAGQAQVLTMLGRLTEAAAAEEAAEVARLLGSGSQLVFALTQQCLAASWSGGAETALRLGEQAVQTGTDSREWAGALARYARAIALINAGRRDEGAATMREACDDFNRPTLDQRSLLSACELMAYVEAAGGRPEQASMWAGRAAKVARPSLEVNVAFAALARAHALRGPDPAAAVAAARQATQIFADAGLLIDAGRAGLCAGLACAAAGERDQALTEFRAAARTFAACGAHSLHAATVREQRRLGARVPAPGPASRTADPDGLSPRELDVVRLVAEGRTNQQIADALFVSVRTVETHLAHVFAKLGVTSRTGIVNAISQRS